LLNKLQRLADREHVQAQVPETRRDLRREHIHRRSIKRRCAARDRDKTEHLDTHTGDAARERAIDERANLVVSL
jgi:hypothetical protein